MKKILMSVVAVCALAITTASAQDFSWGVKAGVNISTMGGDGGEGTSARIGYAAGLMAEYKFADAMAVSADLLYSSQGCRYKDGGEVRGYRNSYLNIPILFNYYICEKLAVKAGLQPGFLLSSKVSYDGDTSDSDTDGMNTFGLAIPIGVSYDFAEKFVVDARYNIACTDVYEDFGSCKNHTFQLTVGYKF